MSIYKPLKHMITFQWDLRDYILLTVSDVKKLKGKAILEKSGV